MNKELVKMTKDAIPILKTVDDSIIQDMIDTQSTLELNVIKNLYEADYRKQNAPKCIYMSDEETTEYCVQGPCPKYKTEEDIKKEAYGEVYDWLHDFFSYDEEGCCSYFRELFDIKVDNCGRRIKYDNNNI